ncbi:MAG: DUF1385 domain-containing protein [Lachnospiraceae bacterium]|nr:DUF1385 domain-containing protein [Lachnospiraceae bacterium]
MKNSQIGGQALMEGVMMRSGARYACTVRTADGRLEQKTEDYKTIGGSDKLRQIPFLRGPIIFLDSMKLGMSTLSWSASFFDEEEAGEAASKRREAGEKAIMGVSMLFALVLGIGLFLVLPTVLVKLMRGVISSTVLISLLEGLIRMVIFVLYLILIAQMKEIKRVFMYHGAEHKSINCIEQGLSLTVENAMKSSRFHKRCGTSFILFTLLVSILVGAFVPRDPLLLRIGLKLLLLPLVMSLSYEFIRLAGSTNNRLVCILSKPGLWLQRLTTREPDASMLEVAIASTEAVFDWKTWQEENFE